MIQIVTFLIRHFHHWQDCPIGLDLGAMLEDAGFDNEEINKSLFFLQLLNEQQEILPTIHSRSPYATRIYYPDEWAILPTEVITFLHFLERDNVLNVGQREFIIHALMFLPEEEVNLEAAKTLAALILWANRDQIPMTILQEQHIMQ